MVSIWRVVIGVCAVLVLVRAGSAQPPPANAVRWTAVVADAEPRGSSPRSYRLFSRPMQIAVIVSVFNDSPRQILMASDSAQFTITVRLNSAPAPMIRAAWDSVFRRGAEPFDTPLAPADQIDVQPGSGFSRRLILHFEDGAPFAPGEYDIEIAVADSSLMIRNADGSAWRGAMLESTAVHLVIASPPEASEAAGMHRAAGAKALQNNRPEDAVQSFARAVQLMPNDVEALAGLGNAYLALNRYREAISAYERALPFTRGQRSTVPMFLALAYVAVGDEESASRVLTFSGMAASRIPSELRLLRDAAGRRRR